MLKQNKTLDGEQQTINTSTQLTVVVCGKQNVIPFPGGLVGCGSSKNSALGE